MHSGTLVSGLPISRQTRYPDMENPDTECPDIEQSSYQSSPDTKAVQISEQSRYQISPDIKIVQISKQSRYQSSPDIKAVQISKQSRYPWNTLNIVYCIPWYIVACSTTYIKTRTKNNPDILCPVIEAVRMDYSSFLMFQYPYVQKPGHQGKMFSKLIPFWTFFDYDLKNSKQGELGNKVHRNSQSNSQT